MSRTPALGGALAASLVVALAAAACGSTAASPGTRPAPAGVLSQLRGVTAPRSWRRARIPVGATVIAVPAGWHRVAGDPGTVTFELGARPDRPLGYLNATPATADERPASWAAFRVDHNREEGDRQVRLLGARAGVRLDRKVAATCVEDAYSTSTARYVEIACLTGAPPSRTVIVAASPASTWPAQRATLLRAVSAV